MSRIGKAPIAIPKGVTVTTSGQKLSVKGPKGSMDLELHSSVGVEIEDNELTAKPVNAAAALTLVAQGVWALDCLPESDSELACRDRRPESLQTVETVHKASIVEASKLFWPS